MNDNRMNFVGVKDGGDLTLRDWAALIVFAPHTISIGREYADNFLRRD